MKILSLAVLFFALGVLGAPAARAATPPPQAQLEKTQQDLSKTQANLKELQKKTAQIQKLIELNRSDLITTSSKAQEHEAALLELEKTLAVLQDEKQGLTDDLTQKNRQSWQIFSHLLSISQAPAATIIASPHNPKQTLDGLMILRQVMPALSDEVEKVKNQLIALSAKEEEIIDQKEKMAVRLAALERDRDRLGRLIDQRSKRFAALKTDREKQLEKVARLAAQSKTFQELITQLDEQKQKAALAEPPATPSSPPSLLTQKPSRDLKKTLTESRLAQSILRLPASGNIVRRFGDKQDIGGEAKGITIQTRSGATVVAPLDGEVVYADHFRGYGKLIILEHGQGYHTLLSGLDVINVSVGQWLLAGEPTGLMSQDPSHKNQLYVEFRREGKPININKKMMATTDKRNG